MRNALHDSIRHALLFVVLVAGCAQDSPPATDVQAVTGWPPLVASSQIGALDGLFAVSDEGAATYTIPFDSPAGIGHSREQIPEVFGGATKLITYSTIGIVHALDGRLRKSEEPPHKLGS